MPEDLRPPAAGEPTPRDLLSREELRELLAPIGGDPALTGEPGRPTVLLLSELPEDAELLTPALSRRDIALVSVRHRFRALDQFRQGRFVGVVASLESLEGEGPRFFQRLRELDPQVRLVFLCDAGEAGSPAATRLRADGPVLARPLGEHAVAEVVRTLCDDPPHNVHLSSPRPAQDRAGDPVPAPALEMRAAETPVAPAPDPLLAVEALLETRLEGGDLADGLRRWQQRDPGVGGLVELSDDGRTGVGVRVWGVRAEDARIEDARGEDARGDDVRGDDVRGDDVRGDDARSDGAARRESLRVLREALELLELPAGESGTPAATPIRCGRFLRFRAASPGVPGLALWQHGEPDPGDDLARRLAPILELLDRLAVSPSEGGAESTPPRTWFLQVLDARMQACERHHARLAVVVAEEFDGSAAGKLATRLAACLRGGDLRVVVGRQVLMLLDRPERGWQGALSARLRALDGGDALRVAGVGWAPPAEDAEQLLQRAERLLADHPGTQFVELVESPRSS